MSTGFAAKKEASAFKNLQASRRDRMKSVLKLIILAFSFLALFSACGVDDNTPNGWTWISGSNRAGQAGIYGTKGIAAPENAPGGRAWAVSWLDSSSRLWLFGGRGLDSVGDYGSLNDLWKFDPTTLEWTWVSGSNIAGQKGSYGTKGLAAPSNIPAGTSEAVAWVDSSNNLWLFGGDGYNSGHLNVLWKFDPTALEWTWISGTSSINQLGIYGTKGTADIANMPGGRLMALSWKNSRGELWLFGGSGLDSSGPGEKLNDLWRYVR
jgi:N-acetylneuraminic acid mutarotase